jgi:hypothetical protein
VAGLIHADDMKSISVDSYPRRYLVGAGVVYVLLLIAVIATPGGGN